MRDEDFEALYATHAQPLFGFLAYRTGDRGVAEDLLADTFEKALRGKRGFDRRKASEKTWLYSIALNTLRDHIRKSQAEGRAMERSLPIAEHAPDPFSDLEHRDEVTRALGVLSQDEREAVALRFGADMSVPEMARVLGLELTTVEGRVYRALRKLRGEINDTERRESMRHSP